LRTNWTTRLQALALVVICAAGGWSAPRAARFKAVVLDFPMAPRIVETRDPCTRQLQFTEKPVETEKDIRSWWLGAQDVYYNANMGKIGADLVSDSIRARGPFELYSREDLKYYYADKKELLAKKFNLSTKAQNEAILELNPVSIGRDIGVDKVIVGHICDSEFRRNRATSFHTSATSFNISVYDVRTGKVEFNQNYGRVKGLTSTYTNFEGEAQRIAADLAAFYGAR
jgi:hypothetical protein